MSEALILKSIAEIDTAGVRVNAAYIRTADYIRAAEMTVSGFIAEFKESAHRLRGDKVPSGPALSYGTSALEVLDTVGISVGAALKSAESSRGADAIYTAMRSGKKRVLPAIVAALEGVTGTADRYAAAVAVAQDFVDGQNTERREAAAAKRAASDTDASEGETGDGSGAAAVEGEDRARRVRVAEQTIKAMTRDIRSGSIVPDADQITALGRAAAALVAELQTLQTRANVKPIKTTAAV